MVSAQDKGWMPGAIRKPDSDGTSKCYKPAPGQPFELLAVVDHIAEGGPNTWKWLFNEQADGGGPVSSTFFIAEDGTIYQGMGIYSRAWANGLRWDGRKYFDPEGAQVEPTWHRIAQGGSHRGKDPNKLTVSIEHEGYHNRPRTSPQMQASIDVLHYIQNETGIIYIPHDTLIGHYEISPKNRANCPGPYFDLGAIAQRGNQDPLKVRTIPGPDGKPRYCGTGFYDLWQSLGGLRNCGYPLSDEEWTEDLTPEKVTIMRFERVIFKFKPSQKTNPIQPALLKEAIEQKWV